MARIHKNRPNTDRSEYTTQKSFRLYHDQDVALIDWLAEYAKRYKQTDLIRLALYTLAGLDMPAELAELLPTHHASYQPISQPLEPVTSAADEFNAIILDELDRQREESRAAQEELIAIIDHQSSQIAALHDRLDRQPVPVTTAHETANTVSSGLDLSRPRPGHSRSTPEMPAAAPEYPAMERSSGIDMSRPRAQPTIRQTPVNVPETDDITEADRIALGKLMARSIKNAQPGRNRQRRE